MQISNLNIPRFYALDFSRGLAALGILAFHLSGQTKPLNALYILVDYFFVLSGFVLSPQLPNSFNASEIKSFVRTRFYRLVPTAWIVIVFSYVTQGSINLLIYRPCVLI